MIRCSAIDRLAKSDLKGSSMRIETTAVRVARGEPVHRGDLPELASPELGIPHVPGIDLSTTYGFHRSSSVAESMDALLEGAHDAPNSVYARLHNPTVARFEDALARLEGADTSVAFASGMAATSALLIAAGMEESGSRPHVVAVRPVYGGTDHLLTTGMLGTEVSWVDADRVGEAIRPDTGLVFVETPANPTLDLVDIHAVAHQIRTAGARVGSPIPLAVDSTFATPILQNPIALGADLVLHSATIGDHSLIGINATLMDGVVIGENCIVAGGSFMTEGTVVPDNSIVMGMPGKVVRSHNAFLKTKRNALIYHRNALAYARGDHRAWTGPEFEDWNRQTGSDLKAEYRTRFKDDS